MNNFNYQFVNYYRNVKDSIKNFEDLLDLCKNDLFSFKNLGKIGNKDNHDYLVYVNSETGDEFYFKDDKKPMSRPTFTPLITMWISLGLISIKNKVDKVEHFNIPKNKLADFEYEINIRKKGKELKKYISEYFNISTTKHLEQFLKYNENNDNENKFPWRYTSEADTYFSLFLAYGFEKSFIKNEKFSKANKKYLNKWIDLTIPFDSNFKNIAEKFIKQANVNLETFVVIKSRNKNEEKEAENEKIEEIAEMNVGKEITKPHQRIFFGAPGTGKSYRLKQEANFYFPTTHERVTFHSNYMYGNLIGSYKPFPKIEDNKEIITYKYVPGVLMKTLIKALVNPNKNYLLLIEEINRANVAAVFGDFFQLLDRDSTGKSEYPIAVSEELQTFLRQEINSSKYLPEQQDNIKTKLGSDFSKIMLPSNLYIWATMNSADQGVMPMDTAFKRRWEFEYIGIDDVLNNSQTQKEFQNYQFFISKDKQYNWNDFRQKINDFLITKNIPEDKLIGPYFISKTILENGNINEITETIANKVLMYLYDDAGKHYRNAIFDNVKTFSHLRKNFLESNISVFNSNINFDDEVIIKKELSK